MPNTTSQIQRQLLVIVRRAVIALLGLRNWCQVTLFLVTLLILLLVFPVPLSLLLLVAVFAVAAIKKGPLMNTFTVEINPAMA